MMISSHSLSFLIIFFTIVVVENRIWFRKFASCGEGDHLLYNLLLIEFSHIPRNS